MDSQALTKYIVGKVSGDSFLSSVAQCLQQVTGEQFSEKMLRQECQKGAKHFAGYQNEVGGQKIDDYIRKIEYCVDESENTIEGRPEIEGQILSNCFQVRIHVIEKKYFYNTYLEQISKKMNLEYPNNIFIIKEGDKSFKPVLKNITKITSGNHVRERGEMNEGDQGEKKIRYKKRAGTAGVGGQFYEIKLSMLAFVSLQATDEFYLASNMEKAEAFDDVVFNYHIKCEDGTINIHTIFLQAKHTDKQKQGHISLNDLLSSNPKHQFRLSKYLDSYQKIKKKFDKFDPPIFNKQFEKCRFIIYTNYILEPLPVDIPGQAQNVGNHISNKDRWITDDANVIAFSEETQRQRLKTSTNVNQDIIDVLCGKYELNLKGQNVDKLATELAKIIGDCDSTIVKIDKLPKGIEQLANNVLVRDDATETTKIIAKLRTGDDLEPQAKIFKDSLTAKLKKNDATKSLDPEKIRFEIIGFPSLSSEKRVAVDEVKQFLSKLKFVFGQKKENELDGVIKKEIIKLHPENLADTIYESVKSDVESWWKNDKPYFLTNGTNFIKKALDRIECVYLSAWDKLKKRGIEMTGVKFKDTAVKALMTTIGQKPILNIVAKEGTTQLSSIKLCQTLDQELQDKRYIFTDINELLNFQDTFLQAFKSDKKVSILLIECNSSIKWANEHIEKLQSSLMSIINEDPTKILIIISEQEDLFARCFKNDPYKFHEKNDTIHFNDLTNSAQGKMMESEVKLNGKTIQIKDFIDIEIENASNAITTKMLKSFINNEKLIISNAPNCLDDLEEAYAKLQYEIPMDYLRRELLDSSKNNTMFVISGINQPNKGTLSQELIHLLRTEHPSQTMILEQKIGILKVGNNDKTIIIIPNQNNAQSLKSFQSICSTIHTKSIYWVTFTINHFYLLQVYDPCYYIKRKFNYKQTVALKLELILQKKPSALFIFNDEADQETVRKLVSRLPQNYLQQLSLNRKNQSIVFAKSESEATQYFEHFMKTGYQVYWLETNERSKSQFSWHRTHGTIPDIDKDPTAFQSDLLVKENNPYLFIFSDEADIQNVKNMIYASCEAKQQQFANNCKDGIVTFSPKNIAIETIGQHQKTKESRPVHWLKVGGRENEQLIWEMSHGSLETLQKFIDRDKTELSSYTEEEFIMEFRNKAVIVADEPGMGKTTSLTSVSQQMLDKNWVIRINFVDCKLAIEKLPKEQSDICFEDVYNFLSSVDSKGLGKDSAKQLLLCKLNPKQTHGWPILILFDGFDEIREDEQHKIILLLKYITHYTSAKVWVTTRLHKTDTLENSLLVFATYFEELQEAEQKTFLERFWKVRLGPKSKQGNIYKKLKKCSSGLLKNATHILGQNISRVMGIPLQLRLLGEALKDEVANYLNGMANMEPNFNNVNTLYVYEQFIKEKYDIFVKDKIRINENDQTMIAIVLRDITEKHWWYAIRLLFPNDGILPDGNEVRKNEENYVKSVGIIQSLGEDSNPTFIHRTFAEYFVAESLVNNLNKANPNRYKCTIEFLLKHMFEENNKVIHNFLDRMLGKCSPIHIAILDNTVKDLYQLVKESPSVDVDTLGRTALHLAAQEGYLNVVNIVLEYGCDKVNLGLDALGRTALHYAVTNSHATAVNHILHHLTKTDLNNIFAKPLHTDMEIGDSLFQKPEHLNSMHVKFVNVKDGSGTTCFQYSIERDRGIACTLLLYGANIGCLTDAKKMELAEYFTYHCANTLNNIISGQWWLSILGLLLIKWPNTTEIAVTNDAWDEIVGKFINYGHTKVIEAIKQNMTDEEHIERLLSCNTKISYTFPLSDEDHLKVAKYILGECKNRSWISTFAQTSAQNGNLETLKYIIEQEQVIDYNVCMLHAINGNQLNIVAHLYKKCSQYITHFKSDTALHLAAKYDRLDIVKYLVKNGADVNACNSAGKTPVQYAIESYAITIISYLSEHGATIYGKLEYPSQDYSKICTFNDINVQVGVQKNLTELAAVCSILAEKPEYDQVADFIISQVQHDINYGNEHGTTLLHIASAFQSRLFAKYLIEHGADINIIDAEGRTPLHIAVHAYYQGIKNHETVTYLLGQGAAYDEKDNSGNSVFAHFNHMETICDPVFYLRNILVEGFHDLDKLLQQGSSRTKILTQNKETNAAIYNARNSDGNTLLHLAAESSLESFEKSFKLYDSDLEWRKCYKTSNNNYGNSPLHLAAASGQVQNATRLIKYGCPFNSRNNQNQTPVELARINSHTDVVDLIQLIEKTFNAVKENKISEIECEMCVNFPNATHEDGKTMLHWAAWNGHVDIAKALIKKESYVEANDKHGWKPLHYAAQNDQFKTVEFLLYHCAIFNPRNEEGKTPLEVATGRSVKFLDQINSIYNHFEVGNLVMASNCLKSICQTNNAAFNAAVQSCDNFGNTFLHYAAARNDTELVKFLLENGAPFDVHNKMMKYPIYLAHDKRIRKLLRGIERMFEWIYPPIHDIEPAQTSQQKITLCKNARDALGNTVLHAAVVSKANHINCVRLKFLHLLIEDNFNINATNKQGCTPLDLAIMHSHFDFIRFLLKKGGKINNVQDEYIQKMLQKADAEGRPEIVDVCKSLQKL